MNKAEIPLKVTGISFKLKKFLVNLDDILVASIGMFWFVHISLEIRLI